MTPVVLLPIATQIEIVAELEKQFSRLDEAVANLQRAQALWQATLAKAFVRS